MQSVRIFVLDNGSVTAAIAARVDEPLPKTEDAPPQFKRGERVFLPDNIGCLHEGIIISSEFGARDERHATPGYLWWMQRYTVGFFVSADGEDHDDAQHMVSKWEVDLLEHNPRANSQQYDLLPFDGSFPPVNLGDFIVASDPAWAALPSVFQRDYLTDEEVRVLREKYEAGLTERLKSFFLGNDEVEPPKPERPTPTLEEPPAWLDPSAWGEHSNARCHPIKPTPPEGKSDFADEVAKALINAKFDERNRVKTDAADENPLLTYAGALVENFPASTKIRYTSDPALAIALLQEGVYHRVCTPEYVSTVFHQHIINAHILRVSQAVSKALLEDGWIASTRHAEWYTVQTKARQ